MVNKKNTKPDRFPNEKVEAKWIKKWGESKIYETDDASKKKKYYFLDMYPYPSGEGLHMGHMENYTASDIYSRYMRMKGYEVLHPMGWDSFGLPTENYAIKTGQSPKEHANKSTTTFKSQQTALGCSYDWSREIASHDPEFMKWTQWFFLFLFEKGLAYRNKAPVNWCSKCQTVLANEQVVNGNCERCDTEVSQKDIPQWFFKVTDYADRLLEDLKDLDWPESTKEGQRNWIGKSEGIDITYIVEGLDEKAVCFTTRPDTNFGATFVVAAPDSDFVKRNIDKFPEKAKVEKYVKKALKKTELERQKEGRGKTGVFTGLYAINDLNGYRLPIYVGDFVLASVGTGVLVGVPGHDLRDFEFAKVMGDIEIKRVVVGPDGDKSEITKPEQVQEGEGTVVNSGFLDGMDIHEATEKIMDYIEKKGWGKRVTHYRIRDWLISRQRYWGAPIPIIYCEKCGPVGVPEEDLPVLLPDDIKDYRPKGKPPLANSPLFSEEVKCPKCGGKGRREMDTMDTFVDSAWYYFRFTDPHNNKEFASSEKIKKWMPVDFYMGGAEHTVGHLIYSRFFTKALFDAEIIKFEEPFQKLRHQGMVLAEDGRKMSKRWGNVINPDDVVNDVGADAARMYTMFMGPLEDSKAWSTKGLRGVRRFVDRLWRSKRFLGGEKPSKEEQASINRLIKRTGENIEKIKLNVCVSDFMIFVNEIYERKSISKETWKTFLKVIAPLAPFIAEELWSEVGEKYSIHQQSWPKYDEKLVKEEKVTVAIQVNGKVRGEIEASPEANEEEVVSAALEVQNVKKYVGSKNKIKKSIYVQGRILNLIL